MSNQHEQRLCRSPVEFDFDAELLICVAIPLTGVVPTMPAGRCDRTAIFLTARRFSTACPNPRRLEL
jgi:hypothetical protein